MFVYVYIYVKKKKIMCQDIGRKILNIGRIERHSPISLKKVRMNINIQKDNITDIIQNKLIKRELLVNPFKSRKR